MRLLRPTEPKVFERLEHLSPITTSHPVLLARERRPTKQQQPLEPLSLHVFQSNSASRTEALPSDLDPTQETRIVLEAVFKPVIV